MDKKTKTLCLRSSVFYNSQLKINIPIEVSKEASEIQNEVERTLLPFTVD